MLEGAGPFRQWGGQLIYRTFAKSQKIAKKLPKYLATIYHSSDFSLSAHFPVVNARGSHRGGGPQRDVRAGAQEETEGHLSSNAPLCGWTTWLRHVLDDFKKYKEVSDRSLGQLRGAPGKFTMK